MARMLSSGATGADVVDLQLRLNSSPPTQLALLSVDGIFGPKTRARVVEFQTNNGLAADLDLATANAIRSHKDVPGFFPFSAYAHIRGNPFSSYAAEQIANQVEHGVTSIVSHVASVAAGAVDAGNTVCLGNNTNIEDVRLSTVIP